MSVQSLAFLAFLAVTVCVCHAVQLRDLAGESILWSDSRSVLITA